jgi:hypothetical protein
MRAAISAGASPASRSVAAALAPLMGAVLVGFLVIGAALPVLPLHVRDTLGFGPAMVGVVAGCQFAAALVARFWSGRLTPALRPDLLRDLSRSAPAGRGRLRSALQAIAGS